MKIVNFGSLNIDHVYSVNQHVKPGETISSRGYRQFCGGKGLNQSIAAARAGAVVQHYGKIGSDGKHLKQKLTESGVDANLISITSGPTGHAVIQVSSSGENAIIVEGGANKTMDSTDVKNAFNNLSDGDWLLLQNEINGLDLILSAASKNPCKVVLNPAPMTPDLAALPLDPVNLLILNEIESLELTGQADPSLALTSLIEKYPHLGIVLTLGAKGAIYADKTKRLVQEGFAVSPVDTTAAGDTFVGYLVASLDSQLPVEKALRIACKAASICVTRSGAADSIPTIEEVLS